MGQPFGVLLLRPLGPAGIGAGTASFCSPGALIGSDGSRPLPGRPQDGRARAREPAPRFYWLSRGRWVGPPALICPREGGGGALEGKHFPGKGSGGAVPLRAHRPRGAARP